MTDENKNATQKKGAKLLRRNPKTLATTQEPNKTLNLDYNNRVPAAKQVADSKATIGTAMERAQTQRNSSTVFKTLHNDLTIERQILAGMIASTEFMRVFGATNPHWFENPYIRRIAKECLAYYARHRDVPGMSIKDIMEAAMSFDSNMAETDLVMGLVESVIEYLAQIPEFNHTYATSTARDYFIKRQIQIRASITDELMQRGQIAEALKVAEGPINLFAPTEGGRCNKLVWQEDIELKPPVWLVKGLFEKGQLIVLTGPFSTGKSFLALDWCKSMAAGVDTFDGRKTMQGKAVYVYSEGIVGFKRRMDAWDFAHETEGKARFPVYPGSIGLTDPGEVEFLMSMIDEALPDEPPLVIVIDTLHRNFGGGGNDITKEMRTFSNKIDILRQHYNCTVIIIHHPPLEHGKSNSGKRPAGSGVLENNCDASYYVEETAVKGTYTVSSRKPLKDGKSPEPFSYTLAVVGLGVMDEDGGYVTSCIVSPTDYVQPGKASSGKKQTIIELLGQDLTHEQIAKIVGASRQYVSKVAKAEGLENEN